MASTVQVAKRKHGLFNHFIVQDFERAFHAELLLEADLEAKQREDFRKLPKWIRQYAYRAWQDRIYFDRNVTWFQQEVSQLTLHLCHVKLLGYASNQNC